MPFPHPGGRITFVESWTPIHAQPVDAPVRRCDSPTPTRLCVQVRDSVTLGPLRDVTVRLGMSPARGAEQTFAVAQDTYGVVATAQTDAEGWVRFGGTRQDNPLDDNQLDAHSWALEVTTQRANPSTEFQEVGAPDPLVLSATVVPARVYHDRFHCTLEASIDWDDPVLPADLRQITAAALGSPLRLFIDDGANFGNQAAAFFLLQTLHDVSGDLGGLDLSICASDQPLMGEEHHHFTIYQRVRAQDLSGDALGAAQLDQDLRGMLAALRLSVEPVLTAVFTDLGGAALGIVPANVVVGTQVQVQDDPAYFSAAAAIDATGTYDALTGIDGQYLAERLAVAPPAGVVWVRDHGAGSYHVVAGPGDPAPNAPDILTRGVEWENVEPYFDSWICVGIVVRATVRPYQRTIRNRFDIIRRDSPMAVAAGLDGKIVDAFPDDDDDAIGLVAASDDSSPAHAPTMCQDSLRTRNAVFLQPYQWKRGSRLSLSAYARNRATVEALSLPPHAGYLIGPEDFDHPWVARLQARDADIMTAYGLHQPHGSSTEELYGNLVRELLHLHAARDREVVLVVIYKAVLPALPLAIAQQVRVVQADAVGLPAYDAHRPLTILKLTTVSNTVFTNLVDLSTLPVILEGANTMNMAMAMAKPFLSVATQTTAYPSLGCQDHDDRFATALGQLTGLLRGEVATPDIRPGLDAGDALNNPVLSHWFERVLQPGPWSRYFTALSGYLRHDRRNQLLLALYRLQVRRGVRAIASCPCRG